MSSIKAKELGRYYTPESIADSLAQWAIRSGSEQILEPSAGDGALIDAILKKASEVSRENDLSILAFDVDLKSINKLRGHHHSGLRCVHADFLDVDPCRWAAVDAVVANPPFTRNHDLERVRRGELRRRFSVYGAAGLWVHFIVQSMNFIRRGGRLISIVPMSTMFTDYGASLVQRLSTSFHSVGVFELEATPAWSQNAQERGAIITAEGFSQGPGLPVKKGVWGLAGSKTRANCPGPTAAFEKLLGSTRPLSEFASLSIGVVTGRNRLFLLNERERVEAGIPDEDVRPVVSRARHLSGVHVDTSHLRALSRCGEKTMILSPRRYRGAVKRHLSTISKEELSSVAWFSKRSPWWRVELGPDCDAILTYMNHIGPRLALAGKGIVCTNTLHRVVFSETVSVAVRRAAVLSTLTTFGLVAAERFGRAYSGGVLKFELKDARRLPILPIEGLVDEALFRRVDIALRDGARESARELVDSAAMKLFFAGSFGSVLEDLRAELDQLRLERRPRAKTPPKS